MNRDLIHDEEEEEEEKEEDEKEEDEKEEKEKEKAEEEVGAYPSSRRVSITPGGLPRVLAKTTTTNQPPTKTTTTMTKTMTATTTKCRFSLISTKRTEVGIVRPTDRQADGQMHLKWIKKREEQVKTLQTCYR